MGQVNKEGTKRIRPTCPKCGSVQVHKIRGTGDFMCQKDGCGWKGKQPKMVDKVWGINGRIPNKDSSGLTTDERLEKLYAQHRKKPTITKSKLAETTKETPYLVKLHWEIWAKDVGFQ